MVKKELSQEKEHKILCLEKKPYHLKAGVCSVGRKSCSVERKGCSVERKSCSARKRKSGSQRKTWDQ